MHLEKYRGPLSHKLPGGRETSGCAIPWRTSVYGAPSAWHFSGHGSCVSTFVAITDVAWAVTAVMSPGEFQPTLIGSASVTCCYRLHDAPPHRVCAEAPDPQ